jgi:tRNA(Ile)-lysidine synthase
LSYSKLLKDEIKISIGEEINLGDMRIGISRWKKETFEFPDSRNEEIISEDSISDNFLIRRWKRGDKFKPLGLRGSKNVSDFLTEQKVVSYEKKNQLVLLNNNRIVWVIGFRIDDRYKITKNTKKALKLWMK